MSFRVQRLRGRGEVHYATGHALSTAGVGANKKGLKWRQGLIWSSEKNTTPSIAPGGGKLSRPEGDSMWRWLKESHSGQVTQNPGWERNSKKKSKGHSSLPYPPIPPTSKTVAPTPKSACLPLDLDPVLCPQDDSHTSKWRPVRSQEPNKCTYVWNIAMCVCVCVPIMDAFGRVVWSIATSQCSVTTAISVHVNLDLGAYMRACVCVCVCVCKWPVYCRLDRWTLHGVDRPALRGSQWW